MKNLRSILLILLSALFLISCKKEVVNTQPSADFTISPDMGRMDDVYIFDAFLSSDKEDNTAQLLVRWDFETDGIWDTEFSTVKLVLHSYDAENSYNITLEVKDSKGLTSSLSKKLNVFTRSTFIDNRDMREYEYIIINDQIWMAENLVYKPDSGQYNAYNNDESLASVYGYLYDWETAMIVCPNGWHLPSEDEWDVLIDSLGGKDIAGGKMKESGTNNWASPNTAATNESGLTILPGGNRSMGGKYRRLGELAFYWSSTVSKEEYPLCYRFYYNYSKVGNLRSYHTKGYSVRCIRD